MMSYEDWQNERKRQAGLYRIAWNGLRYRIERLEWRGLWWRKRQRWVRIGWRRYGISVELEYDTEEEAKDQIKKMIDESIAEIHGWIPLEKQVWKDGGWVREEART